MKSADYAVSDCSDQLEIHGFRKEAICIVLIRQDEKPYHLWLPTYLTSNENNFQTITKIIKILVDMQQEGQFNLFIGYNTFLYKNGYNRTQAKAYRSNAIGIDLDFNKLERYKTLSYEESIDIIKKEHKEIFVKYNPMVVKSGGGCQLYFLLKKPLILSYTNSHNNVQTNTDDINEFRKLSQYFNSVFSDCGADTHCKGDTARIFRIPLCYSLKYDSPRLVRLTEAGTPSSYKDIPDITPTVLKAKRASKQVEKNTDIDTSFVLQQNTIAHENIVTKRIRDLYNAIEQKDFDIEGYRNHTLYIFSALVYAECRNYDMLLLKAKGFNSLFTVPIPENDVICILNNVIKLRVKITNQYIYKTLYKPLDIDLSLLEENYKEQKRSKEYSREDKINYVKSHKRTSNKSLAKKLCCSEREIRRIKGLLK